MYRNALRVCVILLLLVVPSVESADEHPKIIVEMSTDQLAGYVDGNKVIGRGYLVHNGEHSGFQLWSVQQALGGKPNHYKLVNNENSAFFLKIWIGGDGWIPDNNGGQGVINKTKRDTVDFYIYTDGVQDVRGGVYSLILEGRWYL